VILVLRPGTTEVEAADVLRELERCGCTGDLVRTGSSAVVHVTGGRKRRARRLRELEAVLEIVPTSMPRVRREGWRFFPYHFVQWSAFAVALLGVLVFLAGLLPTGIGEGVDYRAPPEVVRHPWYLGAPLALARRVPSSLAWAAWLVFALALFALLCVPLLDRSDPARPARRSWRVLVALGVLAALALCGWSEVHR
jgi:quinol-cytochrome oxidoreductase complex cytochrome b subunit